MEKTQLGKIESRFADLIWQHEPISTAELVKLCEKELNWKRTTTYTVLKRLSEGGIFQNTDGTVTSCLSRQQFYSLQSEKFVEEKFAGSLPAFLTAFTAGKRLTSDEIAEIRKLIDSYEE